MWVSTPQSGLCAGPGVRHHLLEGTHMWRDEQWGQPSAVLKFYHQRVLLL